MNPMKSIFIISLFILLLVSCRTEVKQKQKAQKKSATVELSASYFDSLFKRDCCGFTGGDGTYSVLLPDGRTVWIFGDTFLGTVNPDMTRPRMDPMYIRNSAVVQDGDSLITLYTGTAEDYSSWVIPVYSKTMKTSEDSIWYWPGDGMVENGKLNVFFSKFSKTGDGMWDFSWEGTVIATFSLPDLINENVTPLYGLNNGVHYGHAIFEGEEFSYIYGAKNGKPHVARYPAGEPANVWEFFNGTGWTDDPSESVEMVDFSGSEQFSIIKKEEKYYYISQEGGFGGSVYAFESTTPFGPWAGKKEIYHIANPVENNDNVFTYNALVHPQFVKGDSILLSYNANTFELEDHFRNADIYRPRFVWVSVW